MASLRWLLILMQFVVFGSGWSQSQRTELKSNIELDETAHNDVSSSYKNFHFLHQLHPNPYMKINDTFHATIKSHHTHQTFDDGNLERAFSHKSRNLLSAIDGNSHVLSDGIVSNIPKLRHAGSTNKGSYPTENENQRLNGENVHNSFNFQPQSALSVLRNNNYPSERVGSSSIFSSHGAHGMISQGAHSPNIMSPSLHTQFNNGGVGHVGNQRVISPVDAYDPHAEPEFLTEGERLEVVLGDTVVLPCQLRNLGDAIVLWKLGERVLSAGPIQVRKDYRMALVEAASLQIKNVHVSDTGNYTCEVEWRGQPMRIIHQLVVLVPPTIEAVLPSSQHSQDLGLVGLSRHMERPIEARVGSSVELECRAEGIPTPQIRWRRPQSSEYGITSNGARITSKRAPRGPIFHIAKVRKEDAGTYICTATNGVGTMSADQIELNVLYPPEVSAAERAVYPGLRGKADLTCIVKAEPRANVTWYREGVLVNPDARHVIEGHGSLVMLRIKNIASQDLGNYSCQAENSQGISRDHIELTGKPQKAVINSSPEGLYRNKYNLTWTVKSLEPLTEVRLLFRMMDRPITYHNGIHMNGSWNNLLLRLSPQPQTSSNWGNYKQGGQSLSSSSNSRDSFTLWGSSSSSSRTSSNRRQGGMSKDSRHMSPSSSSKKEYHVQSHLFRELETDSRYEVIVQTRNKFGWSRPTKSFIFSTRDKDYSPMNVASHPSLRGGLISAAAAPISSLFRHYKFLMMIAISVIILSFLH